MSIFKKLVVFKSILSLCICLIGPLTADGQIITDFQTSDQSQTAFAVSSNDLINSGSSSLLQAFGTDYNPIADPDQYGPISALIDGDDGGFTTGGGLGGVMDIDGTYRFQADLDTGLEPNGYDIFEIQTFTGHEDNRKSQHYDLFASTVGDTSYFLLGSFGFNYDTPNSGSTRLTISDSSGVIASNIDSLRWSIQMPPSGNASVYREFDVFGAASLTNVPEPTSLVLFGGLSALGVVRRRRSKS